MLSDDITLRVYEHQRGPGPTRVLLPDLKLTVVNYRMFQLVTTDGVMQIAGVFLIREFCRVNSNDYEFVSIFLFQLPQLRKYMGAVDSTIGPEIQDDYLPLKFLHRHRPVSINPIHVFRKRGGS